MLLASFNKIQTLINHEIKKFCQEICFSWVMTVSRNIMLGRWFIIYFPGWKTSNPLPTPFSLQLSTNSKARALKPFWVWRYFLFLFVFLFVYLFAYFLDSSFCRVIEPFTQWMHCIDENMSHLEKTSCFRRKKRKKKKIQYFFVTWECVINKEIHRTKHVAFYE